MKKLVMICLMFNLNVHANTLSLETCLDKVIEAAGKAVLNKTIEGRRVARYGIKFFAADLWMVHPTYSVILVGSTVLGAEPRLEKDFNFSAYPDNLCQEVNITER